MKMKKTLLAASLAVAMSGFVAQTTNAGTIKVADSGRVTLAPLYIAEPGFTTKITVTNPHKFAVKAKIVFRSSCTSEEMMDFILYLSPKDVWTGTLSHSGTTVVMSTSDDSSRIPNGTFNDQDPRTGANAVPFFNGKLGTGNAVCASTDANTIGHFEITAAYAVSVGFYDGNADNDVVDTDDIQVKQGMSKSELFKLMRDDNSADTTLTNRAKHNGLRYALTKSAAVTAIDLDTSPPASAAAAAIDSDDGDTVGHAHQIRLITDVLITHPNGANAIYHAPSLYHNASDSSATVSGLIDNQYYDVITGMDTRLGEYFLAGSTSGAASASAVPLFSAATGSVNDTGAYDAIGNVENAIATTNLTTNYLNNDATKTGIVVSFPTRYRHRITTSTAAKAIGLANPNNVNHDLASGAVYACSLGTVAVGTGTSPNVGNYTTPFATNATIPYSSSYTDLSENSPTAATTTVSGSLAAAGSVFNFETQFLTITTNTGFTEGQVAVTFAGATCAADASTADIGVDGAAQSVVGAANADSVATPYSGVPAVGVAIFYDPTFARATMARIFGNYDGVGSN